MHLNIQLKLMICGIDLRGENIIFLIILTIETNSQKNIDKLQ